MARPLSSKSDCKSILNSTFAFAALIIPCGCMWLILLLLTHFSPLVVCPGLIGILYVLERTG
jgi:hypothetical protein